MKFVDSLILFVESVDLPAVEQATEAEEELNNEPEVVDPSDKEEGSIIDEEVVEPQKETGEPENLAELESAPVAHEDVPKKSYASIVSSTCKIFICT